PAADRLTAQHMMRHATLPHPVGLRDISDLTVSEAAQELGTSMRRVRQLIEAGELGGRRTAAGWLISADDVAARSAKVGRPVSAPTAWTAALLLDEQKPEVDRRLPHRARRLLSQLPEPTDSPKAWTQFFARRAERRPMWAHSGTLEALSTDRKASLGGAAAIGLGAGDRMGSGIVDVYVTAELADRMIKRYALEPDPAGRVVLHLIDNELPSQLTPTA